MKEAHAHLDISENQFNIVAGHLIKNLEELDVPQAFINEVVAIVLTTKEDILNKNKENMALGKNVKGASSTTPKPVSNAGGLFAV